MSLRSWLIRQARSDRTGTSVADRFRRRRWEVIREALDLHGHESVIDVGGNNLSWWFANWAGPLTRCNMNPKSKGIRTVADGCALPFGDATFDVAFSNSVIEHIPTWEGQRQFAAEIQRVGKRYFVQTPNYWFPVEPHYLFPGFQYLPVFVRRWLHQHFDIGAFTKATPFPTIRLLTQGQLRQLFPRARIVPERLGPLVKSWYVVG